MPIMPEDDSVLIDSNGVRIKFFRDADYAAAPPLVAYQGETPTLIQCSPQGALKVDASVTVGEVNIGDVGMYLRVGGINQRWNGLLNPDLSTYAAWVQDQRMYFDVSNNLKVLSAQGGTWNINNISGAITLPTGAATSSKQDTGNTFLASIDGKTPALGQALAASSVPVVLTASQLSTLTPLSTVTAIQPTASNLNATVTGTISANQSGTWNLNNISGTVSLPTGAATAARQDTGNSSLASIDGKTPALGQALAAGSVPVVLTASQLSTLTPLSTVNVTQSTAANLNATSYQGGTWTVQPGNTQNTTPWLVNVSAALPTGSNVIGAVTQSGGPWTQNVTQFGGSSVVTGTGASGAGIPRVTVSNDSNILATQSGTWNINNISGTISLPTGAATAARQDTGNSSLSSIDGKTPALGQALAAGSVPVVLTAAQLSTLTPLSTVAATQSGTWTVQPGNTQNTTPWLTQDSSDGPVAPGVVAAKSQLGGAMYNSAGISLGDSQQAALQMDSTGNLRVSISGSSSIVSTANSTTTPLGANGVWTGTSELVQNYASVVVYVDSDVPSATNGVTIQFSSDNVNWGDIRSYTHLATNGAHAYPEFPRARYFRVSYTNGGSAQAYLRIQTIYHYSAVSPKHTTLAATLYPDETAVMTRSVVVGQDPLLPSAFNNAKVNSNGQVLVTTSGATFPTTTGATESLNKRSYQTAYSYTANNSGTEYPVIFLRNPNTSGKTVYVRSVTMSNTTGASKSVALKVYSDPTVTANGTTLAPTSMYIGGGAAAPATLVTTVPTATSNGTLLSGIVSTNEQGTLDYDWGLLLSANNSLLVTVTGTANNQLVTMNIIWTEA